MASSALDRARTIAFGVLSASAVATVFVGVHLARDHAEALAARSVDSSSVSQNVPVPRGFGNAGRGDDPGQAPQLGQLDQGSGGSAGAGGSSGSDGFGQLGQLGPLFGGSGQPQARSGGS